MDTGKVIALTRRMIKKEFEEVGPYHYVGSVLTVDSLPTTGNKVGDVYNVGSTLDGGNYAWNGTTWDKLGGGSTDDNAVHKTGNENVAGKKVFAEGPYGTTNVISTSTINLSNGVVFTKVIKANTTFIISGVPTGKAATFNLILTNGGSATVTWPASVKWSDGNPPTLTTSGVDVLTFLTPNGGTTWYGTVALGGAA